MAAYPLETALSFPAGLLPVVWAVGAAGLLLGVSAVLTVPHWFEVQCVHRLAHRDLPHCTILLISSSAELVDFGKARLFIGVGHLEAQSYFQGLKPKPK